MLFANFSVALVVITLINIPKFERNSQQAYLNIIGSVCCNYFDKYTKIWKELTTERDGIYYVERL